MSELVTPTVNLNGTSKAALLHLHMEALRALMAAENKLAACYPHGRDYQTMGTESLQTACDQHWARTESLHRIRQEIETIAERISDQ